MDEMLAEVLQHWCTLQGLPHLDAEELLVQPNLRLEQREWLSAFVAVWDGVVSV
jgi:hypothetical protein